MLALFFIGSCICILLDQLSKYFVYASLRLSESIPIIKGLFQLTYCENRGAAFGVLQNQIWLFVLITIIVIGSVLFFMVKKKPKSKLLVISLTLLTGGAIGNFIDRIFRGFVVDFIETTFIDFPIFNIADCFVVIGAILLALYILFFSPDFPKTDKKKEESQEKEKTSEENAEIE